MSTTNKVIEYTEWSPSSNRYMAPKINDKGAKSIMLISEQSKRSLHLNTPLMMTWGISDFTDSDGNSDGRFKMTLNFPNDEYKTPETTEFLEKMTVFQEQILDDAVKNSELWWGKKMSKEIVKHTFFPFIKYPKDKNTKEPDYDRAPSISVKVPLYGDKWDVELYDTNYNVLFPSEDTSLTPIDFVPKLSKVACIIQCSGIWIGGKGWGLTWKLVQSVVKPKATENIKGVCHIQLSDVDKNTMNTQDVSEENESPKKDEVVDTNVEDSDEEEEDLTGVTLTTTGYMKDSFITDDGEIDSSDENYVENTVEIIEGNRARVSLRKISKEDMETESDGNDSDFFVCTDELEEEEYE